MIPFQVVTNLLILISDLYKIFIFTLILLPITVWKYRSPYLTSGHFKGNLLNSYCFLLGIDNPINVTHFMIIRTIVATVRRLLIISVTTSCPYCIVVNE